MNRGSFFLGMIFVVFGGLLLLDNFAILRFNVWKLFWPMLVIVLGVWILWQSQYGDKVLESESVTIDLEGASEGRISLHHGAGELRVAAGTSETELLSGTFDGGIDQSSKRVADRLEAKIKVSSQGFPFAFAPWIWGPGNRIRWDLAINPSVPLSLEVHSGANDARLDLSETNVTNLEIHTGASATEVHLPAQVEHTRVKVEAGAASVKLIVPEGVAARIDVSGGLIGVDVDQMRFPKQGKVYCSPEFESAPYRVEIKVEAGVGSISVN